MKKLINSSLISFIFLGILTSCSSNDIVLPVQPNTNISSNSNEISNQYIVTAKAIIDKMPKATQVEQEKLIKDFTPLIKSLNRYALDNLIKYAVKVLQDNLKPNEKPNETAVAKLIYPMLSRHLDIRENLFEVSSNIFMIALEKDPKKQDKMILDLEKPIKKLVKADIKETIDNLNGKNSNITDFIPVGSPLSKRLIKMLEDRL
ncbi:MAG: hypothetical protein U0354_16955 [Candidatus Sericytochromatia bacterium]